MDTALVVGGTRFIGRHTVEDLLAHDYGVTVFTRGEHDNPFAADDRVAHVRGDRTVDGDLERAADRTPDVVIDCVAYHPDEVQVATELFADAAYVYVSSGSAYARPDVPLREGGTPLHDCPPEQADDDSRETYGPRKAEGDRAVVEAAERGVNATSVRPMLVYGPHDYTERLDYWIARVAEHDRVLIPGDGDALLHRAYVEDVASALRVAAERGEPGEAYNVADRRGLALDATVDALADALDTEVDVVHASARELASEDLAPGAFPTYTDTPYVAATGKLAALGWESTPVEAALDRTVEAHADRDHDREEWPDRDREERVLDALAGEPAADS